MRARHGLAAATVAGALAALSVPAIAATDGEPAGVHFLETGSPAEAAEVGAAGAGIDFVVVNGSPSPTDIRVWLVEVDAPEGEPGFPLRDPPLTFGTATTPASPSPTATDLPGSAAPTDPSVPPLDAEPTEHCSGAKLSAADSERPFVLGTIADVQPGTLCLLRLQLETNRGAGVYTGTLVATGTDGTADELSISITLRKPPAGEGSPPAGLEKPLPPAVTLSGVVRPLVHLVAPFWSGGSSSVQLSSSLADEVHVTPLVSTDGAIAVPSISPTDVLSVPVLPGAGAYAGSISGADGASLAALQLNVRHGLFWPVVAVALGVVAGFLAQAWVSRVRPALAIRARLDEIVNQAEQDFLRQLAYLQAPRPWVGQNRTPLQIYVPQLGERPPEGALGAAIHGARQQLARAGTPDERERLLGEDAALTRELRELRTTAGDAERLAREANEIYWDMRRRLAADSELIRRFEASIFTERSRHLLGGGVADSAELTDARQTREELLAGLEAGRERLASLTTLTEIGADQAKVKAARLILAGLDRFSDDAWAHVDAEIAKARDSVSVTDQGTLDAAEKQAAASRPVGGTTFAPIDRKVGAAPAANVAVSTQNDAERLAAWLRGKVAGLRPTAISDRIAAGERIYVAAVFVVAILTGLNTNYAPNATFGASSWDYVALVLWGFAATSVIELAKTAWTAFSGGPAPARHPLDF